MRILYGVTRGHSALSSTVARCPWLSWEVNFGSDLLGSDFGASDFGFNRGSLDNGLLRMGEISRASVWEMSERELRGEESFGIRLGVIVVAIDTDRPTGCTLTLFETDSRSRLSPIEAFLLVI